MRVPWKPIAILTTITTLLLLLPFFFWVKGPLEPAIGPPKIEIPPIGTEPIPTPSEAASKAPTQTLMRNVWFRIDQDAYLDIHSLRGQLVSKTPGAPLNLDNKTSFILKIDKGTIGMRGASLDVLMNRYIFGYPNPPLRRLHIEVAGGRLRQSGVIHKLVNIPFTMWAEVSASNGKIRIHPTKIETYGISGIGLMRAVGMTLEKMLKLPKDRGISAQGNDLLIDPERALPPPQVDLHLVDVRIEGDELVQVFDAGHHLPELKMPRPEERTPCTSAAARCGWASC